MIKAIHYYTGLTIGIYIGTHLLNHLLILHSEAMHINFMQKARKIYRHYIVEAILLTAVLLQILSGIFLIIQKWPGVDSWFDWVQLCSGLYLSLFLANHIRAVMVGRRKLHIDTNLYYGAGVMNMWPQKLFYIPYYSLAILAFVCHIACTHRIKMKEFVPKEVAEQQAIGIMILGCVATLLIIFKMSHLKMPAGFTEKAGKNPGKLIK
jgi:succinate dehydrogenase/fumarate reductase cytochrome b subunit